MKKILVVLESAAASLWLGCSSTPVVLAPVGPNPAAPANPAASGQLEVFSALRGRCEGDNPTWFQHSDYYICDQQGREVKHVGNTVGYYAVKPRRINLPPGNYLVKAPAKDYLWVEVPVVIDPGRVTKVHLDDAWRPATGIAKTELVSLPDGGRVGWSTTATR